MGLEMAIAVGEIPGTTARCKIVEAGFTTSRMGTEGSAGCASGAGVCSIGKTLPLGFADSRTRAVMWTLGFDPTGGVKGWGMDAVFRGWVGVISLTSSGTGADPGMMRRGRFGCSTAAAGCPVLRGGEDCSSFSTNTRKDSRAEAGRSAGGGIGALGDG